jgi:vacuolar-type H+-ATPase subunit H
MENIMQAITEAEEQAAAIKQAAQDRAALIVEEAEKKASETKKNAIDVCRAYTTTQNGLAMREAQAKYDALIEEKKEQAKADSEDKMKDVDAVVVRIVGRIISGDC